MNNGSVCLFGVRIDKLTLKETLSRIEYLIDQNKKAIITHVHVTGMNIAYEQEWFREFLNCSNLVYCDGMGVKLGVALTGQVIPERFTLADWIWSLAELSATKDYSWYFLGNTPGSAEKAADMIRVRYPNLSILGCHHGYFNMSFDHPENLAIIAEINKKKPTILFVGLGMPAQEKWLRENWKRLDATLGITCGGIFDALTGLSKRGPSWINQHYLEWLIRVLTDPKKYFHRYFHDIPLFLYRLIKTNNLNKNLDLRS